MKRIIFVTGLTLWSMGKGHGGPAFTQTVLKYIRDGWDVYLISNEPTNKEFSDLDVSHNILIKHSFFYPLTKIPKIRFFIRWLEYLYANAKFKSAIKQIVHQNPVQTVIYAYEIYGVRAGRKAADEFRIPLVTRFQGTILCGISHFTVIERFLKWQHFEGLSTPADLIIMTDDGTFGDKILKKLGNTSPTVFWKNGLDLIELNYSEEQKKAMRQACRKELKITDSDIMLLTVSRLVDWKRVERSIYGLYQCAKQVPQARLVIVGDGEARPRLEQLVQSLGLENRVIFTGSVTHDKVYDYLAAADIFLSLYDLSNVGNPLLEAMTLGKCIITLDVGTTREEIKNRENGILLTYDALDQLGNTIVELSMNEGVRRELGEHAAEYAKTHFWSWSDRMNAEVERIEALLK